MQRVCQGELGVVEHELDVGDRRGDERRAEQVDEPRPELVRIGRGFACTRYEASAVPSSQVVADAWSIEQSASNSTRVVRASRPTRSRAAISTRNHVARPCSTSTRTSSRPRRGLAQRRPAGRGLGGRGRARTRAARCGCAPATLGAVTSCAASMRRALDLVPGLAPDELGIARAQLRTISCNAAHALGVLAVSGAVDAARQQVERVGLLDAAEVHRDLEHRFLGERVGPARRRREHQIGVGDERGDRLLDPRAEIEALDSAASDHDALCRIVIRTRRARARRGAPTFAYGGSVLVATSRSCTRARRSSRSVASGSSSSADGPPAHERVVELGQAALQHARRGQHAPRARLRLAQQREELRAATSSSQRRGPGGNALEPLEQRRDSRDARAQARGVQRDDQRVARAAVRRRARRDPVSPTRTSDTPPLDVATRRALGRRARNASSRQRSTGGVPTVVTSTTRRSAAYTSCPKTPWLRPSVAKIRPTSPRGIMPIPTSSRSPGEPIRPTTDAQLAERPR